LLDNQRRTVHETSNAAIAGDQVTQARSSLNSPATRWTGWSAAGKGVRVGAALDDAAQRSRKRNGLRSASNRPREQDRIGNLDRTLPVSKRVAAASLGGT